ncbi:EAL domain-containing protein [Lelliottia nimipressuralis]|jgi:EAL domain-containing protein (putative c-di-GMP-specific phosphodiesterase class I)|uniref:EAL domain-containing protein n=2 Tax=Lelliottia nimipressuralis TaxID=69220 RepID=A0ABY3P5C6_9ENTR|nr:EAL domain-containing protein [Lelliottia nimipressuralis]MCD4561170.1 EAL domain-containing protein [Lelliottia nimipressuralis]RXJ14483.1 EAL domain-containing protein [Lelliottia nimipressuralis]TYT33697.1 EAL domain-containing protein [Lelliottia nimipressuralis]
MMNIPESSLNSVDLYCALMMGEIVPYYQPVIDARTQTLHGLEVLMRWALADVDATPVALISAFEENGLLSEMTQHLLRQVADDINELDALLPEGLHLSFNASPAQVEKPGFVFDTLSFLAALPLEKYRLVVEVTEAQPLANTPEVAGTILKLQLADVAVYFDDFGTGCANLNCIEQFNVDGLKIDRLFVEGLSQGKCSATIISLIAGLAQSQNLALIAEGVETPGQSQALCEMGIQIQQGYLFSNALSKAQLQQYLAA